MFRLMLQKLTHKKWMMLCLLIGNILLIAVAICHPMYQTASTKRMLTDEFEEYKKDNNTYPGLLMVSGNSQKKDKVNQIEKINSFIDRTIHKMDVKLYESVDHMVTTPSFCDSTIQRDNKLTMELVIGNISNFKDHVKLLAGEMCSDKVDSQGRIEAVLSQTTMVAKDLLIGEELVFKNLKDKDGKPLHFVVKGVIGAENRKEPYWAFNLEDQKNELIITDNLFDEYFVKKEEDYNIRCSMYRLLDYKSIQPEEVTGMIKATEYALHKEPLGPLVKNCQYEDILKSFNAKSKTNQATLMILQVPLMLLLCAFLFMISRQMLTMEQNEISLMKSRGAKRIHIILLYLMQSLFLCFVSLLIGLPLGKAICRLLGTATAFLEFTNQRTLNVEYDLKTFLYAGGAILVSLIMTVLPVIKYSGVSIVNLKQSRSRAKKPLWQRLFFDVICLGISFYGYYSFSKSQSVVLGDVMSGKSLDPLLYMCSSLFILGAGFLFLRLQPLIIKLLFVIFKRSMGSVGFSSYLNAIRSGAKQQFIMMFMILTVALGIFHATVARTILSNAESNTEYLAGADFRLQEVWADNSALRVVEPTLPLEYYEPEYTRFQDIKNVESTARVLLDGGSVKIDKNYMPAKIMGIIPKEFAKVTTMKRDLLYFKYNDYLNVLASDPEGVLLSENFMKNYGYHLGDKISYKNSEDKVVQGRVYGFVNYWPTYMEQTYSVNEDGELQKSDELLIISNLTYLQKCCDLRPYQVWIKVKDSTQPIYDWVEENKIKLSYYNDYIRDEQKIKEDNLFQGTNGILTLSFIVILILCAVGYLIYWIMSIRSRELLFGVLRAMGMSKSQIIRMLINEQIFSGLSSIGAGALIGYFASKLYVPMIQYAYASENQVLPLQLIMKKSDMQELFIVIGIVLLICLVVLARIVAKMNITKALKLGED